MQRFAVAVCCGSCIVRQSVAECQPFDGIFFEANNMMTLEQVRQALQDRNLAKVASATNLHYETVRRVYKGDYKQISYNTIKELSDYLQG